MLIKKFFRNIYDGFNNSLDSLLLNSYLSIIDENYRNECEFRLFGLKRSGNHAFVNWLTTQFKSPVFFLNNIVHFSDPFETNYDKRVLSNCVNLKYKPYYYYRLLKKKCLIYSYEDMDIRKLKKQPLVENKNKKIGKSKHIYNLLIIRDPFNLMASRLKKRNEKYSSSKEWDLNKKANYRIWNMEVSNRVIELWKVYAKEYIGETNILTNKILINYNKWFANKKYRNLLANTLSLDFSDTEINSVPNTGSKYSFDGKKYDGKAQKMKVLERWKLYMENPEYIKLFNDKSIFKLSYKIFGNLNAIKNIKEYQRQ